MPWVGVVLIGVAVGRAFYPGGARGRWCARLPAAAPAALSPPAAAGRHSLLIYLAHQPLLIALVALALLLAGIEPSAGGLR